MLKNTTLIQHYIPLILLVLLAVSCEKNENVEDVIEQVEFLESSYFGICFSGTPTGLDTEVIITDNELYFEYFNQKRIHPYNLNCDTAILPHIDFNKYLLIGKFTNGGGCSVKYDRQVTVEEENNKLIYKIDADYFGLCEMLIVNMNWALIPQKYIDYSIEFQVE